MYSQRQEDLALFSSHLEAKKAGPLVCPICNQTNTIVPKGAPIGEPSGEPVVESEPQFAYAACTLHVQIADTQFSLTLITYLKGEVRRTLGRGSSQNTYSTHLGE